MSVPLVPMIGLPLDCAAAGRVRRTGLLLLLFAFAGCGGSGTTSSAQSTRIDTVGGVPHLTSSGEGAWSEDSRLRADTAGMVDIGVAEGAPEYVLGEIGGVALGEDGRVYVADGQALEIRVFSADGEFLARMGREGEGPGEFRDLSGLGSAPGGGVAALDGSLGRVTLFAPDGTVQRSFRLERPYMMLVQGALVRFDSAGHFYDRTGLSHGIGVDSVGVVRYAPDGTVEDTILVSVHEPNEVRIMSGGRPRMSFTVPYAARPSTTVGPDGVIHTTAGDRYEIVQLSSQGDTLRVIRREVVPPALTEEERANALSVIRDRYRDATGAEPRALPDLPTRKPAIMALHADAAGRLWVLTPTARGADWDVFDPEGQYLGAADLPPMASMAVGRDRVAGVIRDDMGVPKVRVVPLTRGAGAAP